MSPDQYSSLLTLIIPQILAGDPDNHNNERQAIARFYRSSFAQDLHDEKTKLWHYGPALLRELYHQQQAGGAWDYQEAA